MFKNQFMYQLMVLLLELKCINKRSRRFKSAAIADVSKEAQNELQIKTSGTEWDTNAITQNRIYE